MKKTFIILSLAFLSLSSFAASTIRIDATTDDSLIKSFSDISAKLNPTQRQDLSNASAIIMFYGSAMGYSEEKMREIFNDKSAQELIDIAQSYCPSTKDKNYKLKASSKADFSHSFVIMLMNLEIEDQREFSELIAHLMMVSKMNNLKEEELLKELDGLSGKEIIARFKAVKDSAKQTKM